MGAARSKRAGLGPPARGAGDRVGAAHPMPGGRYFVLKLLVVLQLRDHPLLQPDVGLDTAAYAELARRVVAGDLGLGPGLYFISPLYIYFLAAGLAVTDSFTAVRVLQVLLGTASVGFVFLTARDWFGERAAWIAAGVATFTGLFTFYESLILQASLDAVLTSAALLCVTRGLITQKKVLVGRPPASCSAWPSSIGPTWRSDSPASPPRCSSPDACVRWPLIVAGLAIGVAPVAIRNVVVSQQWSIWRRRTAA